MNKQKIIDWNLTLLYTVKNVWRLAIDITRALTFTYKQIRVASVQNDVLFRDIFLINISDE